MTLSAFTLCFLLSTQALAKDFMQEVVHALDLSMKKKAFTTVVIHPGQGEEVVIKVSDFQRFIEHSSFIELTSADYSRREMISLKTADRYQIQRSTSNGKLRFRIDVYYY